MMRGLFRLLFLLAVAVAAVSLFRGIFAPKQASKRRSKGPGPISSGKLFECPVCGTYIPADESLRIGSEGERQYFCSAECLARFEAAAS